MIRHQFKTEDDVTLNAVEAGNPLGQPVAPHALSLLGNADLAQAAMWGPSAPSRK
jgi:hypothetical protein